MSMGYIELLVKKADEVAPFIHENGFAPKGCNGPYCNQDTSLRNSAHWFIVFQYLAKLCKADKYREVAELLMNYLLDDSNYGLNGAPLCREDEHTDNVNGLIGPAWVAEAFIYAYQSLGRVEYLKKAFSILNSAAFQSTEKMWEIIDTNGKNWGIDRTLNHQVWYAAICKELLYIGEGLISGTEKMESEVEQFIGHLPWIMRSYPNGVFLHIARMSGNIKYAAKYYLKATLRFLMGNLKVNSSWNLFYQLEEGYLSFDVYGFAILKQYAPELVFEKSGAVMKAAKLCQSEKFISHLVKSSNKYAFAYNSPLYEYAYIRRMFTCALNATIECETLLTDHNKVLGTQSFYDENTLNARCYELIRYLECN